MAMRDDKGRFIKRMKDALSGSKPATVDIVTGKKEVIEIERNSVSVNVVPNVNARQSARRSYNMSATITIIGNLVGDPELRQTPNGKSVLNFALAYTPRKPDGTDGETSFYNCVAWEYIAENMAASFKKGDRLVVLGRVKQEKWTDKESEKIMSRLAVTAEEVAGSCRFHTVEMSKVARKSAPAEVVENVEEDIFS